jgi:hypothetical protein
MKEFEKHSDISPDFTGVYKIISTGNIHHVKDGKYHNETGPAIIWQDGSKFWYINGLAHREDGPSTEYINGGKDWCYKGKNYGYDNQFTIESWKEKVQYLKREEELKIFT